MVPHYSTILKFMGVTAYELEKQAGLGKGAVTKGVKNGIAPSLETLEKLNAAFPNLQNLLSQGGEDSTPLGESVTTKREAVNRVDYREKYISLLEQSREESREDRERLDRLIGSSDKLLTTFQSTVRGFESTMQALVIGVQSTTDLLIRYLAKSEGMEPQDIATELENRLQQGVVTTMVAAQ